MANATSPQLKCSGEKAGCDRCAASRHKCEYTRSGSHSSRKGKKSSRHSADNPSDARETSGSPSSRGSSHRGQSSKSKSGHGSGHRTHAPAAAVSTQGHSAALLSQADYPMASQADAYGMSTLYSGVYDPSSVSQFDNLQHHDAAGAYQHVWTTGDATTHTATTTGVNPTLLTTTDQMYAASGNYQYQYQEDYGEYQSMDPRYWPQ